MNSMRFRIMPFHKIKNIEHINLNIFFKRKLVNRLFFWPASTIFSDTDNWNFIIEFKDGEKMNYKTSFK